MKMLTLASILALSLSTAAFAETPMPVPGGMPNNCDGASRNCDAGGMTTENALGTAANAKQQNMKTAIVPAPLDHPNDHTEKASQ